MALVSKRPGRTRMLNYYTFNFDLCLVDLMGYGFAEVNQKIRDYWIQFMKNYFVMKSDSNLKQIYILIDGSKISTDRGKIFTMHDLRMFEFLDSCYVPYSIIITKADAINKPQRKGIQIKSDNIDINFTDKYVGTTKNDLMNDSHNINAILDELKDVYQKFAMISPYICVTSSRIGFGITELLCLISNHAGFFQEKTPGN